MCIDRGYRPSSPLQAVFNGWVFKTLKFKNPLGKNFYFKPPFQKNLFSLRFSVGSYLNSQK